LGFFGLIHQRNGKIFHRALSKRSIK
jgi:hypothetical protein